MLRSHPLAEHQVESSTEYQDEQCAREVPTGVPCSHFQIPVEIIAAQPVSIIREQAGVDDCAAVRLANDITVLE